MPIKKIPGQVVTNSDEEAQRIEDWHDLLADTLNDRSLDGWLGELRNEIKRMNATWLISSEEAYELLQELEVLTQQLGGTAARTSH